MKKFRVHMPAGGAAATIEGRDLKEAIEHGFKTVIVRAAGGLGSAAGYVLDRVTAEYAPGILGGAGGVEVSILAHGMDLAHREVDKTPRPSKAWIYAGPGDLPEPVEFDLEEPKRAG